MTQRGSPQGAGSCGFGAGVEPSLLPMDVRGQSSCTHVHTRAHMQGTASGPQMDFPRRRSSGPSQRRLEGPERDPSPHRACGVPRPGDLRGAAERWKWPEGQEQLRARAAGPGLELEEGARGAPATRHTASVQPGPGSLGGTRLISLGRSHRGWESVP